MKRTNIEQLDKRKSMTFKKKYQIGMSVLLAAIMIYGVVNFIDGPIKPCEKYVYCGKGGQPHTLEEYEAFRQWETLLIVVGLMLAPSFWIGKDFMRDTPKP
jgi:hypothetical protein